MIIFKGNPEQIGSEYGKAFADEIHKNLSILIWREGYEPLPRENTDFIQLTIDNPTWLPPGIPQNLSVSVGESFITLNWFSPIDNGGSLVTEYRIYRGTSSGQYTLIFLTSDTSFTDTLVSAGITYYYIVTAINSVGESLSSNEVTGIPLVPASSTPTTTISTTTSDEPESTSKTSKTGSFSHVYLIFLLFCAVSIYKRKCKSF